MLTVRNRPGYAAAAWSLMYAMLGLRWPGHFLIALPALAPFLAVFAFTGVPGPPDGVGDILYWHRGNLVSRR